MLVMSFVRNAGEGSCIKSCSTRVLLLCKQAVKCCRTQMDILFVIGCHELL